MNCEEFERRGERVPKNKKPVSDKQAIKITHKIPNKNTKKVLCVEIGSTITIKSQNTNEIIELGKITSKDNPFYLKEINSIVHIKGISYKIIKII